MKELPIELPEKYYLDYFNLLVRQVQDHYVQLLSREEKSFIRRFYRLTEDAQCLYLRLANRRAFYFRMSKVQYAEISDIDEALQLLLRRKFFTRLSPGHAEEAAQLLLIYTKAELIALAQQFLDKKEVSVLRKLKKDALIPALTELITPQEIISLLSKEEVIVRPDYEAEMEMLKFLYFGHLDADMTQFVVRDIGYIKTESYDQAKLKALFSNRKEAEDKLQLSKIYREFKRLRDEAAAGAEELFSWFVALALSRNSISELAIPHYDKLCLRLGKLLEQQLFHEQSLQVYQCTDQPPARERRVRLMHKLGQTAAALEACQQIKSSPANAEERFFAEDFMNKVSKKKRTRKVTDYLKNSDKIILSAEHQHAVEQGVLQHLQEKGHEGVHAENYLWRGFFGLIFWDIIFDQESDAIHNPLQTTPSDFYTPLFLEKRAHAFDQRLKVLAYPDRFQNIVRHHFSTKMGMSNPMVGWHESLLPLVEQCYHCLEPQQIASVLLEMARNLRENSRGFPDLFVWTSDSYSFIEVKSPNDQLSAQQLYWLHFFEEQKIQAKVIRVAWE